MKKTFFIVWTLFLLEILTATVCYSQMPLAIPKFDKQNNIVFFGWDDTNSYLVKTNSQGGTLWTVNYGRYTRLLKIEFDKKGDIIISIIIPGLWMDYENFIIKYNGANGSIVWSTKLPLYVTTLGANFSLDKKGDLIVWTEDEPFFGKYSSVDGSLIFSINQYHIPLVGQ